MAKTALILDDSQCFREMVSVTLADGGFQVVQAANGQEGLTRLQGGKVDVIITDLNMPVMDGVTFIQHARARPQHRATPILILTTESQPEMKKRGKEAGATGWIVKPFKPQQLLQVVTDLLP